MHTFAQKPKATQQTKAAKSTKVGRALSRQSRVVHSILYLQQTIGNQAVQRLLQSKTEALEASSVSSASTGFAHDFSRIPVHTSARNTIQPKLKVNAPRDEYEQEADRVADQVPRMPESRVEDTCSCGGGCLKCQKEQPNQVPKQLQNTHVQASDAGETAAPPIVYDALRSPGQPLDAKTRGLMGSHFRHDFSQVRVHTDTKASDSARAINALAYTANRDIVFGGGRFRPDTLSGQRLLAHELTHVLQQNAAPGLSGDAATAFDDSCVAQRQPAAAQGSSTTLANNIRDAVKPLSNISPGTIHQLLSAVQVGGSSTKVRTITYSSGGVSITNVFNLQLQVGPLQGHDIALFEGSAPVQSGGNTRTYSMTITLSPAAANTPPQTLARHLFHEGLHMQQFMDRTLPSYKSSPHKFDIMGYLSIARSSNNHALLLSELGNYIQQNSTGKTRGTAQREAEEIVEKIIEEKYIIDETVRSGLSPKTQNTPHALARSYLGLTTRWLTTYLEKFSVSTNSSRQIGNLARRLMMIWLHIDTEQARRARLPILVPRHKGPPHLPALE